MTLSTRPRLEMPGGNHALLQGVVGLLLYVTAQVTAALFTLPLLIGSPSVDSAVSRLVTDPVPSTFFFVLYAVLATVAYWAMTKVMAPTDHALIFARRGILSELAIGAGIGALLMTLGVAVLAVAGAYRIVDVGWDAGLVSGIAMGLGAAFGEEAFFRGTLFRLLNARFGSTLAVVVTGVTFGMTHAMNPGAGWAGGLAITLSAGLLLTASYVLTDRQWMPVGIHFAWNATQAGIFGITVSGTDTGRGIIHSRLEGPQWLTGGSMGIEGSWPLIGLGVAAGAILVAWCVRRGKWRSLAAARAEVSQVQRAREPSADC